MTEEEFYKDFMQGIYSKAGAENDFSEQKFCEEICDFLVEQAVIEQYDSAFFKKTHLGIRIDAWNFNKDRRELSLFICDYSPDPKLRNLIQSDAEKLFKRVEKFFENSLKPEFYRKLEEADPIYGVAREISENTEHISKVQFFLLSNASLSSRFNGVVKRELTGFETVYDVWDISRMTRIANSGKAKEDIIIDFTEFQTNGIPCLKAFSTSDSCQSYLLALPGKLLADIYGDYGERLLEQNVRTFLQFRGKVNKGIRNTLKNQPEMFFAYNNGLTVTAEDVNIHENMMKSATNLQIVNGGQTTASIFMSYLQDKQNIDLDEVYVQVKLSVINSEKVDEVVPIISQCANTQNKVSAADFFSNHPFHKRIEDLSRRILAPSQGGLRETYWFYERARGQYANAQAKMKPTEKKQFLIQNPKNQMFSKTDLAKYENSFAQLPHFVSKGAQWNFGKFAEEISGKDDKKGLWDKNEQHFNELYFKIIVAKAIAFNYLDKNLMKQNWYGGYKANIITYTLAKFAQLVANEGKFIDFISIWRKQQLSKTMQNQLLKLAKQINEIITDTDQNVTQYCKQEYCWKKVCDFSCTLIPEMLKELVEEEIVSEMKKDAGRNQKIINGIDAQNAVYEKGIEYWTNMINWGHSEQKLTEREMGILGATLRMMRTPPSPKQCMAILKIEERAKEEGFYLDA